MMPHTCSKSGLPMEFWRIGPCDGCRWESEQPKQPSASEMQSALKAIGVDWDGDDEMSGWIVMGLESGPEPADDCEAGIRRMMSAAEYDGTRAERDRIRERLADHFLVEIRCDHENQTDMAICSCALWAAPAMPTVGEAVAAWIAHATEVTRAA